MNNFSWCWKLLVLCTVLVFTKKDLEAIGSCPVYAGNTTSLDADESRCRLRTGNETGCYSCCPKDWNCCDDGSCMKYDPFCRYPLECCQEKYCGDQCCHSAHGVPCGPVCAPVDYTCCNTTTGQLCKQPDTCCEDHCCSPPIQPRKTYQDPTIMGGKSEKAEGVRSLNEHDLFVSGIKPHGGLFSSADTRGKAHRSSQQPGIFLSSSPQKMLSPSSYECFRYYRNTQCTWKDACEALQCLTEVADCGPKGYMESLISLYCDGLKQYGNLFTSEGLQFFSCFQDCVRPKHFEIFQQGIIPCCNALKQWGRQGTIQLNCAMKCGFCKVFVVNAGAFDRLFNAHGDISTYLSWTKHCN